MKRLLAVAVALVLVAADDPKDAAIKADLEKLDGTWHVVAIEHLGIKADRTPSKETLVIGGGKIILRTRLSDTQTLDYVLLDSFTIDPTKKVKELDGINKTFDKKPLYIYEVAGDDLKLALFIAPDLSKPVIPPGRPESFDSSKNKATFVTFAKRVKK